MIVLKQIFFTVYTMQIKSFRAHDLECTLSYFKWGSIVLWFQWRGGGSARFHFSLSYFSLFSSPFPPTLILLTHAIIQYQIGVTARRNSEFLPVKRCVMDSLYSINK